jgi:predicted permease
MNALINVVLPVFGIILTGYLAGRLEVLGRDSAAALNRFVFYFAVPPALFIAMARAPIDKIFNWPFIGAFVGGSMLTLPIALVVDALNIAEQIRAGQISEQCVDNRLTRLTANLPSYIRGRNMGNVIGHRCNSTSTQ